MGFAVKLEKPGGFIGREALLRQKGQGPLRRRLVQFRMPEPDAPHLYHQEPIWANGRLVGHITSGAYGHRIRASLGMGYVENRDGVDASFLSTSEFEIEVAGKRHKALAQFGAQYDPSNAKINA